MVTELNTKGDAPIADPAVRQQVAQLFGESLFGAWPELERNLLKPRRRRRWRPWFYRIIFVGVLAFGFWGGQRLLQPGLQRQVDDQRGNFATELQSFLSDGDLTRAAQFLPLVRDGEASAAPLAKKPTDHPGIDPKDPHLDLIVGAEATLFRYFDADPERLRRIRPHLEGVGSSSPLRLIARFTILSREERAERLTEIEQLRNDQPNRNELEYLTATALEFRKEEKAAREAWERSERLGPAWLGHRFEQAWFELHQEQQTAAQKVARQILRVDPDSRWSQLAISTFELQNDARGQSVRGDAAAPVVAPVQIHFEKLLQSIAAGRRGDWTLAKEAVAAAAAAARDQPPFLYDAFDWLIAEKLPALARELTLLSAWPSDSPLAAAKLARLPATASRSATSAAPVTAAPKGSSKSPSNRSVGKRKAVRRATK